MPEARLRANNREACPFDVPPPEYQDGGEFGAELRDMRDRAFVASERYQEQQWRAQREWSERGETRAAHPELLEFERKLIKRMAKLGVPMFAFCVYRNGRQQELLKEQGLSKAGAGFSPHQYGLAVDIVHGTKAWNLSRKQWALVGHIGKEVAAQLGIKVRWGGDWAFYDPAHWELADWTVLVDRG